MKLEIPVKEVLNFLSDQYRLDIGLKVLSDDKIEINYIDSVAVKVLDVKENVLFIHYELDGLALIITGIARLFMKRKLAALSIEWNPKAKEVILDLKKIPKMAEFLTFAYISEVHFVNDSILMEFFVNDKI